MTEGEACRYTPSMIKSLLAGVMMAAVCAVQAGDMGTAPSGPPGSFPGR